MPMPERVRVKLVAEGAGYLDTTPVVQRELGIAQLIEAIVAVGGKDPGRVLHLLGAGSITLGDWRYRWAPIEATRPDVEPLLAAFPDPRPGRAFERERCVYATIRAGVETIELPREEIAKRRFLQKTSFWDVLMDVVSARAPAYESYSYRSRADVYIFLPEPAEEVRLRASASLLLSVRTQERIARLPLEKITLLVNR